MGKRALSILLSAAILMNAGCYSLGVSHQLREIEVDSETFRKGDLVLVVYNDADGERLLLEGVIREITSEAVTISGTPQKTIPRNLIVKISAIDRKSYASPSKAEVLLVISLGAIIAAILIGRQGLKGLNSTSVQGEKEKGGSDTWRVLQSASDRF